uniref:hypothetical protein n=1 Tax=Pseudomonas viridiflava TaxID=33069 RepID=UPI0013CF3872
VQLNSFLLGPQGDQGHRLVLDMSSTVRAPVQMAEVLLDEVHVAEGRAAGAMKSRLDCRHPETSGF